MVSRKMCVLDERKVCNQCGECDYCDLNPFKKCSNCGRCIDSDSEYREIKIDGVILPSQKDTGLISDRECQN